MPLLVGFGALLIAVLLLDKGLTDASFLDILQGKSGQIFKQNEAAAATARGSGILGAIATSATAGGPNVSGTANAAGDVNPVPGATGSRLDAGFDVTSKIFRAPFAGKIVYATQSDPGWQGGGYLAIQDLLNPKRVLYFAEGIAPTVQQGQTVKAGEQIGIPVSNPYNGIVGNIEFGPASPSDPKVPLAHVVGDPVAVVMDFYNWVRGLGAPAATSTGHAGYG